MIKSYFTRITTTLFCTALFLTTADAGEFPADWFWGKDEQRAQHAELEGKPMPKLDLADWRNGEFTADDLQGKIVVVDFWATWCGPCIAAMPKNNKLHEKYADQGVVILGICGSRNGQDKYDDVLAKQDVQYPSARDASLENAENWKVMWWPTYAVVDRNGVVRALGLQTSRVEDVVAKLLEEQPAVAAVDVPVDDLANEELFAVSTQEQIPAEWLEGNEEQRARLADIENKEAPEVYLSDWMNLGVADMANLKGKVVVLDFWATWCGPCIRSVPKNNELFAKYRDEGMVLIGVCHPRGSERMAQVVKDEGIEFPTAIDAQGKTIEAYKVNGYPDYYVFDRQGKLRGADVKNSKVEDVVKMLLAEPNPESATASLR